MRRTYDTGRVHPSPACVTAPGRGVLSFCVQIVPAEKEPNCADAARKWPIRQPFLFGQQSIKKAEKMRGQRRDFSSPLACKDPKIYGICRYGKPKQETAHHSLLANRTSVFTGLLNRDYLHAKREDPR
jgi:hypothetical protein